jgi:hypothetical protein
MGHPESGRFLADRLKAARKIEAFGERIGDNMQELPAPCRCQNFGVPDQTRADSSTPSRRLDEQAVKFGLPIRARKHYRESYDPVLNLRDNNTAFGDLFSGQLDGVRVRKQCVAVFLPHKRRAPLQSLKRSPLSDPCRPNRNIGDHWFGFNARLSLNQAIVRSSKSCTCSGFRIAWPSPG